MKRSTTIVTSFNGESVLMSDCRCIKGVYYIKNKECFFIDDKWYRVNSGLIVLNHTTGEYILKAHSHKLKYGIIGFNSTTPIYGYFNENIYENVFVYIPDTDENVIVINENVCINNFLKIDNHLGVYVVPAKTSSGINNISRHQSTFMSEYKHSLAYRAENYLEHAMAVFYKGYSTNKPVSGFSKYIPFSWGLEFETNNGVIPPHLLNKHGLIPLRDGSIAGLEYATIPLKGEKGIQNTLDICKILNTYTTTGFDCSFHVHLGGYERSVESILALYILGASLQESIYSFFPSWYINTSVYKRRSYVGPLHAIDESNLVIKDGNEHKIFSAIYKWYSGGHNFVSLDTTRHPGDPNGEHKWTIEQRYTWLNLIPLIFSNRGTVEFRIHPPTHNEVKVFNWIMVCSGILQYATKYQHEIIRRGYNKITLAQVLSEVYPRNISNYLIDYMVSRKATFQSLEISGEASCESDIKKDSKYRYQSIFDIL